MELGGLDVWPEARGGDRVKTWAVPYSATFRGTAIVEATTAEEAEEVIKSGGFDNDPGAEMSDWELTGRAKEDK